MGAPRASAERSEVSPSGPIDRSVRTRRGPLAGVRVADFCWMGVGSVATRLLADFGAEVIKIEDRTRIDTPRKLPIYKDEPARNFGEETIDADPDRGGLFNNYCRNKLGVVINMRTPRGRQLAERLIAESSVVSENFAPGVMERWGLTYERLQELSPDVIYARMSGYGHSGPHAEYRSYGPVVQAVSGLVLHQRPARAGAIGLGPLVHGQPSRLLQLDGAADGDLRAHAHRAGHRDRRVGHRGRHQPGRAGAARRHASTGTRRRRPDFPTGNRLEWPPAAPHGVYPARGDDRWVAIAVFDDEQWAGLVAALGDRRHGRPTRGSPPRRSASGTRTPSTTMWPRGRATATATTSWSCCKRHGVPAGAVQDAEDLNERDPQVAHRGVFFEMDHPVIGPARFEGTADPVLAHRAGQLAVRRPCSARTTPTCSSRSSASATTSSTSSRAEGVI